MWTDFKILEVKVPIKFSGTQGFPLRRDGRYVPSQLRTSLASSSAPLHVRRQAPFAPASSSIRLDCKGGKGLFYLPQQGAL